GVPLFDSPLVEKGDSFLTRRISTPIAVPERALRAISTLCRLSRHSRGRSTPCELLRPEPVTHGLSGTMLRAHQHGAAPIGHGCWRKSEEPEAPARPATREAF